MTSESIPQMIFQPRIEGYEEVSQQPEERLSKSVIVIIPSADSDKTIVFEIIAFTNFCYYGGPCKSAKEQPIRILANTMQLQSINQPTQTISWNISNEVNG